MHSQVQYSGTIHPPKAVIENLEIGIDNFGSKSQHLMLDVKDNSRLDVAELTVILCPFIEYNDEFRNRGFVNLAPKEYELF